VSNNWNVTIPDSEITNAKVSATAAIDRAKMAQRANAILAIPHGHWRTWDALATNLPGTPAADDLGLVTGTLGSNPGPYLGTGDVKTTTSTRYAGVLLAIPEDYEAGQTLTIRAHAGMLTTIADGSCTIDFQAYKVNRDGTVSADLVTTAAQSILSLTAAAKDFLLTVSSLEPGDLLVVRMAVAYADAATATAVIAAVYQVSLLADLR
jgi:hypothetical protein